MTGHALRIVGQHLLDFRERIPAMCEQQLERVFISRGRFHLGSIDCGHSSAVPCFFFHGALLHRAVEEWRRYAARAPLASGCDVAAARAWSRSARMSSMCSIPTERRT